MSVLATEHARRVAITFRSRGAATRHVSNASNPAATNPAPYSPGQCSHTKLRWTITGTGRFCVRSSRGEISRDAGLSSRPGEKTAQGVYLEVKQVLAEVASTSAVVATRFRAVPRNWSIHSESFSRAPSLEGCAACATKHVASPMLEREEKQGAQLAITMKYEESWASRSWVAHDPRLV